MTSIVLSVLAILSITAVSTYYVTDRSIRRTIKKKTRPERENGKVGQRSDGRDDKQAG